MLWQQLPPLHNNVYFVIENKLQKSCCNCYVSCGSHFVSAPTILGMLELEQPEMAVPPAFLHGLFPLHLKRSYCLSHHFWRIHFYLYSIFPRGERSIFQRSLLSPSPFKHIQWLRPLKARGSQKAQFPKWFKSPLISTHRKDGHSNAEMGKEKKYTCVCVCVHMHEFLLKIPTCSTCSFIGIYKATISQCSHYDPTI